MSPESAVESVILGARPARDVRCYWLAQGDDVDRPPERYELRDDLGAAAFDVFCSPSPHLHNTAGDVDRALEALTAAT